MMMMIGNELLKLPIGDNDDDTARDTIELKIY